MARIICPFPPTFLHFLPLYSGRQPASTNNSNYLLLYRDLGTFRWPNSGELWQALRTINQSLNCIFSIKLHIHVARQRQRWFSAAFDPAAQSLPGRQNSAGDYDYNLLIYEEKERAGRKPGSVVDNHSSGTAVADCLKQPTREPVQARYERKRPYAPLFGLAPGGVYRAAVCCHPRGALLPHHFTLTGTEVSAVSFLWHFPWVRTLQVLPGALPNGARTFLRIS
jgi:hypothetical protein